MTAGPTTIARFDRLQDAVVAKSVLQSAGIDCYLADENMMGLFYPWQVAIGGVRLQVVAHEAEAARRLLQAARPFVVEGPEAAE